MNSYYRLTAANDTGPNASNATAAATTQPIADRENGPLSLQMRPLELRRYERSCHKLHTRVRQSILLRALGSVNFVPLLGSVALFWFILPRRESNPCLGGSSFTRLAKTVVFTSLTPLAASAFVSNNYRFYVTFLDVASRNLQASWAHVAAFVALCRCVTCWHSFLLRGDLSAADVLADVVTFGYLFLRFLKNNELLLLEWTKMSEEEIREEMHISDVVIGGSGGLGGSLGFFEIGTPRPPGTAAMGPPSAAMIGSTPPSLPPVASWNVKIVCSYVVETLGRWVEWWHALCDLQRWIDAVDSLESCVVGAWRRVAWKTKKSINEFSQMLQFQRLVCALVAVRVLVGVVSWMMVEARVVVAVLAFPFAPSTFVALKTLLLLDEAYAGPGAVVRLGTSVFSACLSLVCVCAILRTVSAQFAWTTVARHVNEPGELLLALSSPDPGIQRLALLHLLHLLESTNAARNALAPLAAPGTPGTSQRRDTSGRRGSFTWSLKKVPSELSTIGAQLTTTAIHLPQQVLCMVHPKACRCTHDQPLTAHANTCLPPAFFTRSALVVLLAQSWRAPGLSPWCLLLPFLEPQPIEPWALTREQRETLFGIRRPRFQSAFNTAVLSQDAAELLVTGYPVTKDSLCLRAQQLAEGAQAVTAALLSLLAVSAVGGGGGGGGGGLIGSRGVGGRGMGGSSRVSDVLRHRSEHQTRAELLWFRVSTLLKKGSRNERSEPRFEQRFALKCEDSENIARACACVLGSVQNHTQLEPFLSGNYTDVDACTRLWLVARVKELFLSTLELADLAFRAAGQIVALEAKLAFPLCEPATTQRPTRGGGGFTDSYSRQGVLSPTQARHTIDELTNFIAFSDNPPLGIKEPVLHQAALKYHASLCDGCA